MIIKHASSFSAPFNSLLYLPSLDDNSQHGRHGRDCGKRKVRGTDHENHPHHFSYWALLWTPLLSTIAEPLKRQFVKVPPR